MKARVKECVFRGGRMLALAFCILFAAPCTAKLVTNSVDLAALADCCTGQTNGWEVAFLTNYASATSSYKLNNAHFLREKSYAKSPDFGGYIRRLEFDYRSSNTLGRRLQIVDGGGDALYSCEYTSDGKFTNCVVEIAKSDLRQVTFKYDEGGERTTWTIANLRIITESDLAATTNGTALRLKWWNSRGVVSNRVDIYRVNQTARGETNLVYRYDFSKLKEISSTGDVSDSINVKFEGRLYGQLLYVMKELPEVLKISTGDARGALFIKCPSGESYSHIRLVLKRYGAEDCDEASLSYGLPAETNLIRKIELTDTFVTNYISLAAVPTDTELCLNATGNKTSHRVLLSDIAFVTIKVPVYKDIRVRSKIVENASFLDVKDLSPRRAHYFIVMTYFSDATSRESAPSEWFYPSAPPGLLFFLH